MTDQTNKKTTIKRYIVDGFCYSMETVEGAALAIWDSNANIEQGDEFEITEVTGRFRKASAYLRQIADDLDECAYDECGECAADWLYGEEKASKELQETVAQVVDDWADRHGLQPKFYAVESDKTITIRFVDNMGGFEIVKDKEGNA